VDAASLARIYNEGIEDRVATFETRPRTEADVRAWFDGRHPVMAVEDGGEVIAFATSYAYSARACYAAVADLSVYVARAHRGKGAGRMALEALASEAERLGFTKLLSRVFTDNERSRAMLRVTGFREVGTYLRHARLDGRWRDVVIVERLLGEAEGPSR